MSWQIVLIPPNRSFLPATVPALAVLRVIFASVAYAYPNRASTVLECHRHSFAIHSAALFESIRLTETLALVVQDYQLDYGLVNWLLRMSFGFSFVVASAVLVTVVRPVQPCKREMDFFRFR